MKKSFIYCLLITLSFLLAGCLGAPKVKVKSVDYVENIVVQGVSYQFENQDIVDIKMNFHFKNDLAPGLTANSEEHRAKVYREIIKGATLYLNDTEIDNFWGYWPKKSGKNYAKSMRMFYHVPKERPKNSLKFVYDGEVLGDADYQYTYTKF